MPVSLKTYVSVPFQGSISGKPTSKSSKLRGICSNLEAAVVIPRILGPIYRNLQRFGSYSGRLSLKSRQNLVASGIWRLMLLLNLEQRKSLLNSESGLGVKGTVYYKASWLDTATFCVSPVCWETSTTQSFLNLEGTHFCGCSSFCKTQLRKEQEFNLRLGCIFILHRSLLVGMKVWSSGGLVFLSVSGSRWGSH